MITSSHVARVGWSSFLPLDRARRSRFRVAGKDLRASDTREFDFNIVTPEYFDVLSLRCIEGRLINNEDVALSEPVVVIDELLARRYYGKEAVGGHIVDVKGTRWKVVGVVQSGRYRTLQQAPQPTVYFPAAQEYLYFGHLVMRTSVDPALILDEIERDAGSVGTGGRIVGVSTLEERLEESLTLDRLTITLVGACGLIALAMSTLGVYGIMVDAVQRRTREIGLRVALGAGWKQIARLVFLEAAYPAIAGLTAGAILVLAASQAAQAIIYGLPGPNFIALAAAAGLLAMVILLAAIVPLRRALGVHPNIALRAE
jgi:ABC-type antimicrobial peptide transport system permease subunit